MHSAYVVTGNLADELTVTLDEPLPLATGRIRLVVEPAQASPRRPTYDEVMGRIRERQRARGHVPRTKAEIDAYVQAERNSWGD